MTNTPVRQYIGARYVPQFADPIEWDNKRTYEPLTIVLYEGNSYTSRQYVPTGIEITNSDYWALTGNYNAQISSVQQTANNALSLAQTNESDIAEIDANLNALHANTVQDATKLYDRISSITGHATSNIVMSTYLIPTETQPSDVKIAWNIQYLNIFKTCGGVGCLIVHIDESNQIMETMDGLIKFLQTAKQNNISIPIIKFHCTAINTITIATYVQTVKNVLTQLATYNNFQKVYVFNEDLTNANTSEGIDLIQQLRGTYTYVGISLSGNEQNEFSTNQNLYNVFNACNLIGANKYCSLLSAPENYTPLIWQNEAEQLNTTYTNMYNVKGTKQLEISEFGTKPNLEYLKNTGLYNTNQIGPITTPKNNNIIREYFKTALNTLNLDTPIYIWYIEQWTLDDVKYITSYIQTRRQS